MGTRMFSLFNKLRIAFVVLALVYSGELLAQTSIVSTQDNALVYQGVPTGGVKLSAVACNAAAASRWTGWVYIANQRNSVFDVAFIDGDASSASLDWVCQSSTSNATVAGAGYCLPTLYETTSSGSRVNKVACLPFSFKSVSDGNPGSQNWELYIQNMPGPFVNCQFTCGAGSTGADNVTARVRGTNP